MGKWDQFEEGASPSPQTTDKWGQYANEYQVDPAVQKQRDGEALEIKMSELQKAYTEGRNQDAMALMREITRMGGDPTQALKQKPNPVLAQQQAAPEAPQAAQAPQGPTEAPGWFQPGSKSDAFTRGAVNGATFGTANYIGPAITAGIAKVTGDNRPIGQIYDEEKGSYRAGNDYASENQKGAYIVGNVAGGLAGGAGVAGAATKGALAAGAGAKGIIAANAAAGATTGAIQGKAQHGDNEEAAFGATVGGVFGALPPAAGAMINKYGAKTAANRLEELLKDTSPEGMKKLAGLVGNNSDHTPQVVAENLIKVLRGEGKFGKPDANQVAKILSGKHDLTQGAPSTLTKTLSVSNLGKQAKDATVQGIKEGAMWGIAGGGGGAALGDPITGAIGGAVAGALKGVSKPVGQAVADQAGNVAIRMAGRNAIPFAGSQRTAAALAGRRVEPTFDPSMGQPSASSAPRTTGSPSPVSGSPQSTANQLSTVASKPVPSSVSPVAQPTPTVAQSSPVVPKFDKSVVKDLQKFGLDPEQVRTVMQQNPGVSMEDVVASLITGKPIGATNVARTAAKPKLKYSQVFGKKED